MFQSVQFSSVTQSCPALCNCMDCSMPGFPVYNQLLKLAQTHVHWVGDAIQPSHPLLLLPSIFPSIRIFSNESVLHIRWPKYWSFSLSISPSNEYSGLISFRRTGWISLQSKEPSRVFSSTTIWKHQFFSIQSSLWTNSHIHTCLLEIKLRFSNWGKTVEWMSKQGTNTLLPYLYIQFYSNKTYFHFWISVQQNFLS